MVNSEWVNVENSLSSTINPASIIQYPVAFAQSEYILSLIKHLL